MTRVAVSFSGLPRFPTNVPTIRWKEIIKRYDADVFVHTWVLNDSERYTIIDRIMSLFNPRVLKVEPSRVFPLHDYQYRIWPTVYPYNVFSAYASIYESMDLINKYSMHNGFQYDYVIRARFDVSVTNFELKPINGIAIPDDPDKHVLKFKYRDQDLWGFNDLLAYGTQEAMTKYASTYHNIQRLYHEEGVDMCSELFLTSNLISQNVPFEFRPMGTRIIRRIGDNNR